MLRAYTEIGYGNPSFVSTELEYPDGTETRQRGFVRFEEMTELYVRIWVGRTVYVASTAHGFNTKTKPRKALKVLLGVGGYAKASVMDMKHKERVA